MFRSRVIRARIQYRSILSQSRSPCRRSLQTFQSAGNTPVQRVRFKKPSIFGWKRLASFGLYSGCAVAYFYLFFPEIEIEEEESEGEVAEVDESNTGEDDDLEDYGADEDSLFIPLSLAKRKQRSFYRGSDPEWQEFIKLASDKQRHQKIQEELVALIMMHVTGNVRFSHSLGGAPKAGKIWLDIQFPNGPPPEFERTGILVTEDYIALAKRTSSELDEQRINRALWPSAAFSSIYASMRVLWRIQWQKAKATLGIQTKPTREDEQLRQSMQAIQRMQEKHLGRSSRNMSSTPSNGADKSASDSNPVQAQDSSTAKSAPTAQHAADRPTTTSSLPKLPSGSLPSGTEVPLVLHVFYANMDKNRLPPKMEPPRGTCVVSGLVEISGSKARATLDVRAAYHPQEAKFIVISAALRSFKLYRQPPMGGP
ncbi:MAG: hypothetical protein Q9165_006041 [Trypethelium subeluteriae]